jgi:CRISPR-associated exonuclease Cas4
MRIREVKIHNFRSIRDLTLYCCPHVVFVGPNNHGKSNVLQALEFGLSTAYKVSGDDLFAFCDQDREIWIEFEFEGLTDQEQTTFKKYLRGDGSFRVRKTARFAETIDIHVAYNGYLQEPTLEWLQEEAIESLVTRDAAAKTPLIELLPGSGRLTKAAVMDAQQRYIRDHHGELEFKERLETSNFLGEKRIGGGVLPNFFLFPAVRDLTDETKVKTSTSFGRLLNRAIQEMVERDPRTSQIRAKLEDLLSALNAPEGRADKRPEQLIRIEKDLENELADWGVSVAIEITPPAIERIFELGTELHLDDGHRTLADRKGHGLQRAVLFALLRSWAKVLQQSPAGEMEIAARKASESVIFGIEEPELFLHPHAQRSLASSMRAIAATDNHQVFLCTHSAHFVDLEHYKEVKIAWKPSATKGTGLRQCEKELFEGEELVDRKKRFHMARWINPDRGEMFFARHVVFVEGETEKTILPFLGEKLGCSNPEVSIIDCGSKYNLPLYIEIANAFGLPYVVVYDEDPVPDPVPQDWGADRLKERQKVFGLNEHITGLVNSKLGRVEMFETDFEHVAGISKSQGDKKGKALAAVEHFDQVNVDEMPTRLKEIVEGIYTGPKIGKADRMNK